MLTINKELSQEIVNLKELKNYIAIIVDYKKEEEYANLFEKIVDEFKKIQKNFSPKDIDSIINIIEDAKEYYLYSSDEIIETLFPGYITKDKFIHSAYYWIESRNRIEWILQNVLCVASSNKFYNAIDNVNSNYIISSIKLNGFSYKEA